MLKKDNPNLKTRFLALGLSLFVSGAGLILAQTPASAQKNPPRQAEKLPPSVPNQMMVMLHPGADKDEVTDAVKEMNGKVLKTISNGRMICELIQVPAGKLDECMDKVSKDSKHFDDVQRNVVIHKNVFPPTPNDFHFFAQYHLPLINVPAAWSLGASGNGVTVGIIDSGVVGTQQDLTPRVGVGTNIITGGPGNVDNTPGVMPFLHGTFVSTTGFASTNNVIFGAAPAYQANIVPVNVFDTSSTTSDFSIMQGLFYLESLNVRLVNLSVNAPVPFTFASKKFHKALYSAFQDFYIAHNGLLFNAAGNDGQFDSNIRSNGLIVVSAIDSNSQLANFSTRGNPLWFAAPGVNIVSSDGYNQITTASGTSFASPLACSVAALVWGLHPSWTNERVLRAMTNTTTSTGSPTSFGFGIVNAGGAVANNGL